MSEGESTFYVTGGTLRPDAPSYVERQADRELLGGLLRGEFCYVLTSRQMGKSSLMVRTARKLRQRGVHVVILDLTAIGQNLSPEQWYGGLADGIGRQLGIEKELEAYWENHSRLAPVQRLFGAIREVILVSGSQRLTIFVDELDVMRSLPFSTDEFFAAIRECYTRRGVDPELDRLTFCLLGVATPTDLIQDTRITPFNIGMWVELGDFTKAKAAPLAAGFALSGDGAPRSMKLLDRIFHWTRGHPYLTQRLCRAVRDHGLATPKAIDHLCRDLLLTAAARERDDNLLFVRENILRSDVDRMSLLTLYGRVQRGRNVRWDEADPRLSVLRLAGLVRVDNGRIRSRNRIYQSVFDRHWIVSHMPGAERARQRRAFRLGLATAVTCFAILFFAAWLWRRYLDQDPPITLVRPAPPETNAFYLYRAAGRLIRTNGLFALSGGAHKNSAEDLQEVLRLNTNALQLVRIGFQYPCRFPAMPWAEISTDLLALNRIGTLLHLEGKLHEAQGEFAKAVGSYLNDIRLGQDASHGTPIMGRFFTAHHTIGGAVAVARLLPRVDAATAREIQTEMERFLRGITEFTETLPQPSHS
jgi:hypothetical protein